MIHVQHIEVTYLHAVCGVDVGVPFLSKRTLTNIDDFIIHRGFNLQAYFSVPERFPSSRE